MKRLSRIHQRVSSLARQRGFLRLSLLLPWWAPQRFDPRSLFRNGEQGAWYDPSDLSSMYQDAAGTTAAAVGSPVGLRLDKRLGLVRGAELAPNGDFSNGTTGWAALTNCTIANGGNQLQITNTGTNGGATANNFAVTNGSWHEVSIRNTGATQITFYVRDGANVAPDFVSQTVNAGQSWRGLFRSTVTSINLRVFCIGAAGAVALVDDVSCRELPGNHASQSTSTSRPILQQDAGGRYYLSYDGVDDGMATGSIDFSATDKMTVFAGVTKNSDAAQSILVELSASMGSNAGSWRILVPASNGTATYSFGSSGTPANGSSAISSAATFPAPHSAVITGSAEIGTPRMELRVNGAVAATSSASQGTGNYGNYPLYIGRRGGTTLPFAGRDYGLIIRGAATDATTIARVERWLAGRMGIAL